MARRIIYHADCNAFFASVEEVLHPEFREVPMAICGDPDSRRGIILAKNELAKGFGVKTAETIWQAKQKCPDLLLRPARHKAYRNYCEQINAIYEQYTDRVERFGIDESFMDVSQSIHLFGGDPIALSHEIRERVLRETGVSISVGVSFNKIFAKLGSDLKKPNAVTVITRNNYQNVVWPLPVSALLMVGKSTEALLHKLRIRTIGDLAHAQPSFLQQYLGKMGELLHTYACGKDSDPVSLTGETPPPHSIGNGTTFKRNLTTLNDIKTALIALSDTVASRLRKAGLKGTSLQVTIKDANLKVITRQKPTPYPVWLAADLAKEALEIVVSCWNIGVPIRMMAVTAQKLVPFDEAKEQLSFLWNDPQNSQRTKQEQLEQTIDQIRSMFGKGSICPGSIVKNDLGIQKSHQKQSES